MTVLKLLLIYLAAMNLITFMLFGIDKRKAKKDKWRIKEATLLGFSFFGGALGGLIGMRTFHHKTKKVKFYLGVPFFLLLHIALAAACIYFLKLR